MMAVIHFSFWARNLGLITSLRLGHDNAGLTPNWLVEHVLIRNEFTGHCFKFQCGRWLGKGIDDGSIERYLVGNLVPGIPGPAETADLVKSCASPPFHPCLATSLHSAGVDQLDEAEVQTMLSEAINRIIKHHHKSLKERVSWAQLMCGEMGLVFSLIQVFSFGFKSARLFGKNLSVWDFFLKVVPPTSSSPPLTILRLCTTSISPWLGNQPVATLPRPTPQGGPLRQLCQEPHSCDECTRG